MNVGLSVQTGNEHPENISPTKHKAGTASKTYAQPANALATEINRSNGQHAMAEGITTLLASPTPHRRFWPAATQA